MSACNEQGVQPGVVQTSAADGYRGEAGGVVSGRAKFVRPEFVEKIKQSEHWQHQAMIPNCLDDSADVWS